MGIEVVMLIGDRQAVADWVADELGLDRVIAEVLPDGAPLFAGCRERGEWLR